jgi:hypothetical protein
MRFVRLSATFRAWNALNKHAAVLDAHVVGWNAIVFVPRLALSCPAVELPVMPRTNDVITAELAFAKRPPNVIADAGDRAKLAITVSQCNPGAPDDHLLHRSLRKLLACTHIYPRFGKHVYSSRDG